MSAIIHAIDEYTNKPLLSTGDNGLTQHNW